MICHFTLGRHSSNRGRSDLDCGCAKCVRDRRKFRPSPIEGFGSFFDSHVEVDNQFSDNLAHSGIVIDDRDRGGHDVRIMSRSGRSEDDLFSLALQSLFVFRDLILNVRQRHFIAAIQRNLPGLWCTFFGVEPDVLIPLVVFDQPHFTLHLQCQINPKSDHNLIRIDIAESHFQGICMWRNERHISVRLDPDRAGNSQ